MGRLFKILLESYALHSFVDFLMCEDRLQTEARALQDEQEKTEELERIREELEKERSKMESLTSELKTQYKAVQRCMMWFIAFLSMKLINCII